MKLGAMDASGRASVEETGETETVPADTVIAAVGERVDTELYQANGLPLDNRGKVVADSRTLEASSGVYVTRRRTWRSCNRSGGNPGCPEGSSGIPSKSSCL